MGKYEFRCDYNFPVVETKAGKIRGYYMDGLYYFKGVPYARAERFMMPVPVEAWEGIKNCTAYGPVCPPSVPIAITDNDFIYGMTSWPESEDCQNLNIWTKAINDGTKKPVLFYIHGGGLSWGSSIELRSYEATNLSKEGDVVVVSINHRLNALGFMNLSSYGEKYKYSSTVSFADIEAALDWVHENIVKFGGDPDNITIFGHSGGGIKVQAMMQIPSVAGKFKRAVVMSGCLAPEYDISVEQTEETTRAILEELHISPDEVDKLQTVPVADITVAYNKVAPSVLPGHSIDNAWRPVPNGYFMGYPLEVGFLECNKNVPMMIGTAIAEFGDKHLYEYSAATPREKKMELLRERFREDTDRAIAEFEKAYPGKDLIDLYLIDDLFRKPTLELMDLRSSFTDAPLYSYMFAYDFKGLFGGFPAWHNSELSVVFGSYETLAPLHEDGVEKLAHRMIAAWSAFGHKGDPNNALMPAWTPYRKGHEATMVLDEECEERIDFDRELTKLVWPK